MDLGPRSAVRAPGEGTGPPGFEPGFEAPEASVMSKLYYGPTREARTALGTGYLRIVLGGSRRGYAPLPAFALAGGGAFDSE